MILLGLFDLILLFVCQIFHVICKTVLGFLREFKMENEVYEVAAVWQIESKPKNSKFLYTKLRGPSHGIFVRCIALKAESKTLTCLMFTFIICQNTHSTNPTCDLNSVTKL